LSEIPLYFFIVCHLSGMPQIWEVVGGADKGGIIVRAAKETSSAQQSERLSTGALIEQIALEGERLHYKLIDGTGPVEGWVGIKISGKNLCIKTDKSPVVPPPSVVQTMKLPWIHLWLCCFLAKALNTWG